MIRENIAAKKKRMLAVAHRWASLSGNTKQGVSSGNHNIQQSKFQRKKRQEHCSGEKKRKRVYILFLVLCFFLLLCLCLKGYIVMSLLYGNKTHQNETPQSFRKGRFTQYRQIEQDSSIGHMLYTPHRK